MLNKYFFVAVAHFTGTAVVFRLLYLALPSSLTWYYLSFACILLYTFLSYFGFSITKKLFLKETISPQNKAVVITGCDSGFGHSLAKRLDSKGFHVFATCLFPLGEGADKLRDTCSSRLKILELDVTKDESVEKATRFVEENLGSCEFWALVNNAGIGKTFCVDLCSLSAFKDCMEVNLFGIIRMTKALLPLLKKSKGRVVNVVSIAGRVAGPHVAPYFVSKFAAAGLSDVLTMELMDWGISVISIEPEIFRTGLTNLSSILPLTNTEKISETAKTYYNEEYIKNYRKSADLFLKMASPNIGAVVDDMESALTLKYPDFIYCPRRHELFRIPLYIFTMFPFPVQIFFIRSFLFLIKYKKPNVVS